MLPPWGTTAQEQQLPPQRALLDVGPDKGKGLLLNIPELTESSVPQSSLTYPQIPSPLDTTCTQTPSQHGLGLHYSFMGEERSNTKQKFERVKWSG